MTDDPIIDVLCRGERATFVIHDRDHGIRRASLRCFEVRKRPYAQYPVALELLHTPKGCRRTRQRLFMPCTYLFFTVEHDGVVLFDSRKYLPVDMAAFRSQQRQSKAEWLVQKAAARPGIRSCADSFEEEPREAASAEREAAAKETA